MGSGNFGQQILLSTTTRQLSTQKLIAICSSQRRTCNDVGTGPIACNGFLSSQSQLPPACSSAAVTSNGHRISVYLRREPSPALSRICLCFLPGTANNRQSAYSTVIAAHGGSVLLQISSNESYLKPCASDYFVYSDAVAADPALPPSLYLLPHYYGSTDQRWRLDISATGFLSHANAEFVVAQLKTLWVKGDATPNKAAELLLFRHGKWCVKRWRIIHDHGKDGDLFLVSWEPDVVVPLGDGLLCWVDFFYGVLFSNVLNKDPELRYVPYPAEALKHRCFLCTNARAAEALNTDDMAWGLETETDMADSTELWAPRAEVGCARVHLFYLVASVSGGGHVVSDETHQLKKRMSMHVTGKGNVCIRTVEHRSSS